MCGDSLIMARSGRKKIRIEKIQNKKKKSVTFSKRRTGLFKKETELSALCDSPSAMVIFSPDDNKSTVYSIGYPCVNSIMDKFMEVNPPTNIDNTNSLTVHHKNAIRKVGLELIEINRKLEEEEKRKKRLDATGHSYENLNSMQYQQLIETIEIKFLETECIAIQLKECNMPFPYSTFGDALAPK
ncbi:agamous-like MADS-box protein AGL29 [Solanum verrucosum]|uniref:agamous-like MADS-box protein AGL29 n=1 Tax=Solanum verrucosum TaxID=315347 RepID=UPI0020D0A66C|nr:agamous-like MADS-box protein AGL29 [Solanum verrucosum]